jgi:hypothetical protein
MIHALTAEPLQGSIEAVRSGVLEKALRRSETACRMKRESDEG